MDTREILLTHYKRWNIEFDAEEAFIKLKNRVIAVIRAYFPRLPNVDMEFAFFYGCEVDVELDTERYNNLSDSYLYAVISQSTNIKELATALQCFLTALEQDCYTKLSEFVDAIILAIKLSPGAGLSPVKHQGLVILYPAGAELLDKGVVNDVLAWLENYPEIAKEFEQALKIYMDGDSGKYRNLLDNLRHALEQLLKEVLHNKNSLENQKKELLSWLNQRGIHQQVVNLYCQLVFGQYSQYQNDAVKHGDAFSEREIEFMIYLTGTFMRLLLQLA